MFWIHHQAAYKRNFFVNFHLFLKMFFSSFLSRLHTMVQMGGRWLKGWTSRGSTARCSICSKRMQHSQIFLLNITGKRFFWSRGMTLSLSQFFFSVESIDIIDANEKKWQLAWAISNYCRGYVPDAGQGWFLISLLVLLLISHWIYQLRLEILTMPSRVAHALVATLLPLLYYHCKWKQLTHLK